MKTTKIASAILVTTLLSISAVSASHHGEMKEDRMAEKNELNEEYKEKRDSMKMENREEMIEHHKKMMEEKKERMMKMKEIMKPYFDALPQEIQDKLNELKAEKKAKIAEKKEKFEKHIEEVKAMTTEEFSEHRKGMKEKMKTKKEAEKKAKMAHFKKVKEIVGTSTPEAKAFILKCEKFHGEMKEKRMSNKEDRKEMRGEMKEDRKEMRSEHKEKRFELRAKYKKAFAKKLENRLDKIPTEKLEKFVTLIDSRIAKFEANTKLSDAKKERLVAIYEAIKELIEDKLGDTSTDQIVDDLLK